MLIRGVIRGTRQGFAFIEPEDGSENLYVAAANLGGAIHGDRVEASLFRRFPHDFRPEAVVERILERPKPLFTGDVVRVARAIFVLPDSPVLPARIRLKTARQNVPTGSKVLFRIDEPRPGRPLGATLERTLGDAEDPALDAVVVATAHQLPGRFPDEVLDEAVAAAAGGDPQIDARRLSYRDRLVLTIDPKTAKDFDDAISMQQDHGGYHLQVHIADVSSMVREGGALDAEAARRGNSVYFPGGVIPMLPEVLSADAASLLPDRDRRVVTCEIDLDLDGTVRGVRMRAGWIRSAARLDYEGAQRMLTEEEGPLEVRAALREMAGLARLLRANRFRGGGIDLEVPETEMNLDASGVPRRIWRHRSLETNRLIEEFMILANRAVGRYIVEQGMPLLFRVHGEPDPQALERFAEIALALLPGTRPRDLETLPALRRFLAGLPDGPISRLVHHAFLRSMKKAVYSSIDLGHFGLGIDRYCHFTSPIRRYPDLFNHRVVRWLIGQAEDAKDDSAEVRRWQAAAPAYASACSRTEDRAEAAEREMIRIKILRWAEKRLGESFPGRIVGLVASGLFVELDKFPVEGFLPREGLRAGARYDEERLGFFDHRSRFGLRLGDPVLVRITRVDLRQRWLDFQLEEAGPSEKTKGQGRRKRLDRPAAKVGRRRAPARRGAAPIKKPGARADRSRGGKHPRKQQNRRRRRGGRQ